VSCALIPMANKGETNLKSLMSRWSNLGVLAAGAGALAIPGVYATRTDGLFEFTPLSLVASVFDYWCGEVEFKFQFFSSPLVRTRIVIMIVPPGAALPLAYSNNGSYLTTIVEVVGTTESIITVPWLYTDPMIRVVVGDFASVGVSTTRVIWFVASGPLSTNPSPTAPTCLLSIRGGPTLEVGKPSLITINQYKTVTQGLEGEGDPSGPGIGAQSLFAFGERIDDIHVLTKRYCEHAFLAGTGLGDNTTLQINWPVAGTAPFDTASGIVNITALLVNWSYATWFRQAFLGWTGGNAWKVTLAVGYGGSPVVVQQAYLVPGGYINNTNRRLLSGGTGVQLFDAGKTVETSFPARSITNFNSPTGYVSTSTAVACECICIMPIYPTSASWTAYYYHAAGDDFRVGGFMAAPAMRARV